MRIGFDVAQTCVDKAGCGWYADSLIRALVRVAPEHEFDLYHHFGGWINGSVQKGTRIDAPNVRTPLANLTPAEAKLIWSEPVDFSGRAAQPDIVHANCYQAPRINGARLVYTVYDVSFWAKPEFTTEANRQTCQSGTLAALQNADGLIFISRNSQIEFERFLPGWLKRTGRPSIVTPLAPRGESKNPMKATAAGNYWLAVGSLEPRKNYETLLDALELYWDRSNRRLPLKIAGGRGWNSEQLQSRIESLGRKGLVTYLGYVPDDLLPKLYSESFALLFPSWYEGFGLPVLEAMTYGCPVISSDRTSLPEVGGSAAFYVNPADARQIANAMLTLETDPKLWTRHSQMSRVQSANFDWAKTARQTLQFYLEVIKSPQSPER